MSDAAMRQPLDADLVRRHWAAQGFSCALWSDPPGTVWDDYVHTMDEVLMVLDGEVEIEVEGRSWQPRPGEEVHIPRGAKHSVRNKGKTASHWLYGYYG
jgi:quercetin dioxygenase-like cupin family protein